MATDDFSPEELQKDLAFSNADLTSAMMNQAGLFARYAAIAARLQKVADTKELIVEITEAKVDKAIRDAAAKAGEKVTEASLAKSIRLNTDYVKAVQAYNNARMNADLAKNALEAFKQRRDMLVQIGVAAREEMKGELFVKAREAGTAHAQDTRAEVLKRMEQRAG
jgi:hypothetical protein